MSASLSNEQKATRIVNAIVDDFTDRSGLQNAWEEIDMDTQEEIWKAWYERVLAELNR